MDYAENLAFCHGVRMFYFPRAANIVLGVLAALVVIINSLAMASVLRNYRRLRQRIYVFVISLAAVEILAGIVFLSDVIFREIRSSDERSAAFTKSFIYSSTLKGISMYLRIQVDTETDQTAQDVLEEKARFGIHIPISSIGNSMSRLKASIVVLSALNTAIVAFALYKRTTSMGRHHEDFKQVNGTMPDHSYLPAFDTMLRVLSIGSVEYSSGRSAADRATSQSSYTRNEETSPIRRSSSASRNSYSPAFPIPEQSSHSCKESSATCLDKAKAEPTQFTRKNAPVIRMNNENPTWKSSAAKGDSSKRSVSVTRIMSTGRRVSHAIRNRSRSASGTQAYVGRHSYSVMSKRSTACSLVSIWLIFLIMWFLPVVLRETSNVTGNLCSGICRQVKLEEVSRRGGSISLKTLDKGNVNVSWQIESDVTLQATLTTVIYDDSGDSNDSRILYSDKTETSLNWKTENFDRTGKRTRRVRKNAYANDNSQLQSGCVPQGYQYYSAPILRSRSNVFESNGIVSSQKPKNETEKNSSYERVPSLYPISSCKSCAAAFFPLNKSHMIFNALVIFLVWIWLMVSASRLLWLRKHSTNVFVRCSALWRFMFWIAAFYFVTMTPYVTWIILDFFTNPDVSQSPLWFSKQTVTTSSTIREVTSSMPNDNFSVANSDYVPVASDIDYLNPLYSVVSTCLLLCHLAIAPTLYLVRLLGFRRILSALS